MIYVTSDLHGYPLAKFQELLAKANFSQEDFCFILGDVIDRGPESVKLLEWIMLQTNIQLILGNHEAMLLSCSFLFDLFRGRSLEELGEENTSLLLSWLENGGGPTLKELSEMEPERVLLIEDYLRDAPLYDVVSVKDRDYLLVHSGLGNFDPQKALSHYTPEELLWTRPNLTDTYFQKITTVFGHTPTLFYGQEYSGKAIVTPTWIDIDTGAACGGAPMLLRLDDLKEFYAE